MTDLEKLAPYADTIVRIAKGSGIDPALSLAQCLRESGATWAPGYGPKGSPGGKGDGGHGHGLYQIDDRTFADWLRRNDWTRPEINAQKACDELRADFAFVRRSHSMPGGDLDLAWRTAFAAFNCGPALAVKGALLYGDPDHHTAGGDYSKWVWAKAATLRLVIPQLKGGTP